MIDRMANTLVNKLTSNNIIELEDQDIYLYGLQMLISGIVKLIGFTAIAWLLGWLPEALIFILVFSSLRIFAGGYHADTYIKCFIITASATFLSIFAVKTIFVHYTLAATAVLVLTASVLIFELAPKDTPNKRMIGNERHIYRAKTLKILLLQVSTILVVLLLAPQWSIFCNIAAMAMFFEGTSLLPIFADK